MPKSKDVDHGQTLFRWRAFSTWRTCSMHRRAGEGKERTKERQFICCCWHTIWAWRRVHWKPGNFAGCNSRNPSSDSSSSHSPDQHLFLIRFPVSSSSSSCIYSGWLGCCTLCLFVCYYDVLCFFKHHSVPVFPGQEDTRTLIRRDAIYELAAVEKAALCPLFGGTIVEKAPFLVPFPGWPGVV